MKQSMAYQISKEEYKRAVRNGAASIIGKHEGNVERAEVAEISGTYWVSYVKEVNDGE